MSSILGASGDAAKKAFSLFDEFKAFAFKGNVVDLAVGVIIGGAFGNIVKSLVDNLMMPLIKAVIPSAEGQEALSYTLNGSEVKYGQFIGDVVNFLIVALALYIFIVKFLGWLMRAKKEEKAAVPAMTKDQELLTEIRDLLGQRSAGVR